MYRNEPDELDSVPNAERRGQLFELGPGGALADDPEPEVGERVGEQRKGRITRSTLLYGTSREAVMIVRSPLDSTSLLFAGRRRDGRVEAAVHDVNAFRFDARGDELVARRVADRDVAVDGSLSTRRS